MANTTLILLLSVVKLQPMPSTQLESVAEKLAVLQEKSLLCSEETYNCAAQAQKSTSQYEYIVAKQQQL